MASATSIAWGIDLLAQASSAYAWTADQTQALIDRISALPDADDDPLPVGFWVRAGALVRASKLPNADTVSAVLSAGESVLAAAERSWFDQGLEYFEDLTSSLFQGVTTPFAQAGAVAGAVVTSTSRDVANSAAVVGAVAAPAIKTAQDAIALGNKAGNIAGLIGVPLALVGALWAAKKFL